MKAGGALISESPPFQHPTRSSFPRRNRLIAGLADLVVAVECSVRSGTRITTRLALEYGKDVGAVPHAATSPNGVGTNDLLNFGAHCIRSGYDILKLTGLDDGVGPQPPEKTLTPYERRVLQCVGTGKTRADIISRIRLPEAAVHTALLSLESKGYIQEHLGVVRSCKVN